MKPLYTFNNQEILKISAQFEIVSNYDSHVHWLLTGEKQSFLNLSSTPDFPQISIKHCHEEAFKGDWLMGFGWEDSQFLGRPHYTYLDKISKEFPICFIKKDAHSCLINSKAIELFQLNLVKKQELLNFIEFDSNGVMTGLLKESAFYALYSLMPPASFSQIKKYLLAGQKYFISQGITHIRDMTCSQAQWKALLDLELQNQILLYADINFNIENLDDLRNNILPFVIEEKRKHRKQLNLQGVKIFYDGSLGSQTALISENYLNTNHSGVHLWSQEEIKMALSIIWENKLQASIHALGDEAVRQIINVCKDLQSEKITGILNLEHVELLSTETIQQMKSLHIRCHMQPCHWLSDKKWIYQKLSPQLQKNLFRWESLRKAKVPIHFGSDSPIESASIFLNLQALEDTKKHGIEELNDSYLKYFSHPTEKSGLTKFISGKVSEVQINNQLVYSSQDSC